MSTLKHGGKAADAGLVEGSRKLTAKQARDFAAWMSNPAITVAVTCQHDQWYAHAVDFGIAGVGPTEASAFQDLVGLVERYLWDYFSAGKSYEDALLPQGAAPKRPLSLRSVTGLIATVRERLNSDRPTRLFLPAAFPR